VEAMNKLDIDQILFELNQKQTIKL